MRDPDPLINEDADRQLGRITLRFGGLTALLLLVAPFAMAFINTPGSRFFPERRFLDTLSVLVILLPFFLGINRLFAARLRLGRDLVARRRWREAVAALDPFAGPTQRFLDGTGEAHYLLAKAYAGLGDRAKAERARTFVLQHRRGPWADALRAEAGPRNSPAAPGAPIKVSALKSAAGASEKRPTAVKSRRRRRF